MAATRGTVNNTAAQKPKQAGWGFSGKDIRKQSEIETQKAKDAKNKSKVSRFYLKKGETKEIIVLDASIDAGQAFYEHELWLPNAKFPNYEVSPLTADCYDPLEDIPDSEGNTHKPYFVTYLTILDLTPWERKDQSGKVIETVPYSRKLLPIKNYQNPKFAEISDSMVEDYKTFRGAHFKLSRPDGNGISSKIGDPAPIGTKYRHYTEAELIKNFGHPARKDQEGKKVIVPENGMLQPFDYDEVFHIERDESGAPDWHKQAEYLRRILRLGSVMGSAEEEAQTWDRAVEEETDNVSRTSQMEDEEEETSEVSGSDIDNENKIPF